MAGNQGLGSDNMSQADKDKIHSAGGKASHSTGNTSSSSSTRSTGTSSRGTTTNKTGGGITKDDQRRGGQNSHK